MNLQFILNAHGDPRQGPELYSLQCPCGEVFPGTVGVFDRKAHWAHIEDVVRDAVRQEEEPLAPVKCWLLYPGGPSVDITGWDVLPSEGETVQSVADMAKYHTVTDVCWTFGVDAVAAPVMNIHLGPAHDRKC